MGLFSRFKVILWYSCFYLLFLHKKITPLFGDLIFILDIFLKTFVCLKSGLRRRKKKESEGEEGVETRHWQ
ncbi:hypothetical protein Hanom_Chr06g00478571 [Helianthus anomalus]